ncbi:MAG: hypothetical protein AW07_03973 [Candidatus Accumulibacter sp. SK-11]|nr:MAG: hypothetical protein AW07_03973 [Candidatus Accumulibacter sp. SK-11]
MYADPAVEHIDHVGDAPPDHRDHQHGQHACRMADAAAQVANQRLVGKGLEWRFDFCFPVLHCYLP